MKTSEQSKSNEILHTLSKASITVQIELLNYESEPSEKSK